MEKKYKTSAKRREIVRRSEFKRLYGITKDDFDEMLKGQEYKCKICGLRSSELKRTFHLDHCHDTLKIRGILCPSCNTGLGLFRDNIEVLKSAVKYLEEN